MVHVVAGGVAGGAAANARLAGSDGDAGAEQHDFGDTQIAAYDLKPGQIGRIDPLQVQFNGNFALVGCNPGAQGRSGTIEMRWQPLAPLNVPYTATLQLIDPTGATWSVDRRIDPESPIRWRRLNGRSGARPIKHFTYAARRSAARQIRRARQHRSNGW